MPRSKSLAGLRLIEVSPITVGTHHKAPKKAKSTEHKKSISDGRKSMYTTEKGQELKTRQANSMREFYKTERGVEVKERLRIKGRRPKKKAIEDVEVRRKIAELFFAGKSRDELAMMYNVSTGSINRYIKEFSR